MAFPSLVLRRCNKPISSNPCKKLGKKAIPSVMVATHSLGHDQHSLLLVWVSCAWTVIFVQLSLTLLSSVLVPIISDSKLDVTSKTMTTHKDTYRRYSRHASEPLSQSLPPIGGSSSSNSSVLHAVKLSENQLVVRRMYSDFCL
jgi:hypothetical protein